MNLQRLKNKIHQLSNSSDFQNAFEQLKADIREAVNTEESGENKPYYTNHVARELFQKAADFGLSHLIEGEVDAGFRPISGDTTFLDSAVTSLATPTLVISTDSDTMQVTLTSTTVTDASTYQFQVSSSSDFSSPTTIQNTSSTTATYTVTSVGTFYFRLRACGADNSRSNWTATQNTSSEEWTLSSVTSSKGWWDASDSSTVTTSGSEVTQLRDKSGNSLHLAPVSGQTGPTTNSTQQNSLNVLDFNGDCLENNDFSHDISSAIYIAFLVELDSLVTEQYFLWAGTTSSTNRCGIRKRGAGVVEIFGKTSGGTNTFVSFGTPTRGAFHILVAKIHGTSAASYLNGSQIQTGNSGVHNLTAFNLGHSEGEAQSFTGKFAEVTAFTDGNDRQKIEGYLAHKWGLAANLPSDHTYKSSAPIRFTS